VTPRALLSLLWNAEKALDVVGVARELGILGALDRGPVTLAELAERTSARPNRLFKLLDCLESMGLVERTPPESGDDRLGTRYRSLEPLAPAVELVLGPDSIERDRDRYTWRTIRGRLPEVLRGELSIESFTWPPATDEQVRGFEASMAAGCPPIVESFRAARAAIFTGERSLRWLDVGGGDGTVASSIVAETPGLSADVFNLPATRELVEARARASGVRDRVRFVAGDFFEGELPGGYDVVSFVRVLHDWDEARARALLAKGVQALAPGGRLVVCEEFRTRERLAVQFFWTYFLMGVDACESRLREVELYVRELSALGMGEIRVLPGPFDLVIARRAP
jgi:SAM-dependent methyltransferase